MPDHTLRPTPTPTSRMLRALVVLFGHVLLVLALRQATQLNRPTPVDTVPTTWLHWEIAAPPAATLNDKPEPRRQANPGLRLPPGPPTVAATAIAAMAAVAAISAITAVAGSAAPVPPDALPTPGAIDPLPAPPRLVLDLPRRRAAPAASAPPTAGELIRQDRHQPPRPTHEERLAQALGTDTTLYEELLQGNVRRFRSGRGCVETRPTHVAQIDPFNESVRPTPKLAAPCP